MSERAEFGAWRVTDGDVLRALADPTLPGPVFDTELARRLHLPEGDVTVRLLSLVSLGYVEQLRAGGKDGGYTLTERGRLASLAPSDVQEPS